MSIFRVLIFIFAVFVCYLLLSAFWMIDSRSKESLKQILQENERRFKVVEQQLGRQNADIQNLLQEVKGVQQEQTRPKIHPIVEEMYSKLRDTGNMQEVALNEIIILRRGVESLENMKRVSEEEVRMLKRREEISTMAANKFRELQMDMLTTTDYILQGRIRNPKVHLVTQVYNGGYDRFSETLTSLQMNLLNPYVEKIHLLQTPDSNYSELQSLINSEKLEVTMIAGRMNMTDVYDLQLPEGTIVAVANADIFFDQSLIYAYYLRQNVSYAISRKRTLVADVREDDNNRDQCDEYQGSHDAFLFTFPLSDTIIQSTGYVQLGKPGTENVIIYNFRENGYDVQNPCHSIHIWHLHRKRVPHSDTERINTHLLDYESQTAEPTRIQIPFKAPVTIDLKEQDVTQYEEIVDRSDENI